MPKNIQKLLDGNKQWVDEILSHNPEFFETLATGQSPEFLWIGCSDSRVPATEITKMQPGSIFVHRNIANVIVHTDANALSVIFYAVKVLKVKHILVVGHYGCGGVLSAMSNNRFGFIDNWLMHIKDVYRKHAKKLDAITDEKERGDRFVEYNVMEQVHNLAKISFIQETWAEGEYPYIHGLVYKLSDGRLRDLGVTVNSADSLQNVFQYS